MRFLFFGLLLILQLSCVPDNLYLKSPEIYEKPTAGVGCLQARLIRESHNVKYSAEIYNFPFYFSYGKVFPSGWGIGADLMFPSASFLNAKLVTPKRLGFFTSTTIGFTVYYLPSTISILTGKDITNEILLYGGLATSDLLNIFGNHPNVGKTYNLRFVFPLGLRIKISDRVDFVSEIILPEISDEDLLDKELIAYPKFGSGFFYSLK